MKHIISIVGLAMLSLTHVAFGQSDKIKQAMEDQNPKRALKLAEDAELDPEFKKDPEIYFLKAEVMYELMKDEFWLKKNPNAVEDGIKAIQKGKSKADDKILSGYDDIVAKYVALNNMLGESEFNINKYSKAYRVYMTSFGLNSDTTAYYEAGKNMMYAADTAIGEEHYSNLVSWINEKSLSHKITNPALVEAFLYYIDKHWAKERYDSANMYLEQARRIFGASDKLDFYQKEVAKQQIADLPPSNLMMEIIDKNLGYFPTDTFFIRKQNALYLHLIRTYLSNNDLAATDSMINQMAAEKLYRYSSKYAAIYKEEDQFVSKELDHMYWSLAAYYNKYEHTQASNYLATRYVKATATAQNDQSIKERWTVIIDYASKSKSLSFAEQLLEYAKTLYPKDPSWNQLQSSLIVKSFEKELDLADQGALYRMLLRNADFNAKKLSEEETLKCETYIDGLVRAKEYIKAKKAIKTMKARQFDNPMWERKLVYLAKEEFYYDYFMTKVREETVAGMKIEGFEWNGSTVGCKPGKIDPNILQKVEDRINYFRRAAGVSEIYLDPELNQWCQEAALMMQTNNVLNHDPNRKWSCFTDEGATAAKYSLLTKGVHTTTAITAFTADNSNPSVGHRRWVLFPNGKVFGFGGTKDVSVLWALDDSGNVDSSTFMEKFVAWPPEGYTPKMMAFRFWSFSQFGDMTGAKVSMTEGNKNIPLKIQPNVPGYGMPTVVWLPELDFSAMEGDRTFLVTVELKSGLRYEYNVVIMDFDAVGY
jgi:hypothetical protein